MRFILVVVMAFAAPLARSQSPDVRFREAQQKETVQGDLRGAIQIYEEVADAKGSSRALAAQALLRLGRCYEKLGNAESKRAYERLLRQYGDQAQAVIEARKRLAALSPAPAGRGELTATLLFRLDEPFRSSYEAAGAIENVATDGNSIFHFAVDSHWGTRTSALVATEISTGRTRELFRGKFYPWGLSLSPDGQQLAFGAVDIQAMPVEKESIYVIRTDGSNLRQVFTSAGERFQAVIVGTWSPDGNELVFFTRGVQATNQQPFRLSVLSLRDGSIRTWKDLTVTNRLVYPNTLSFSPDGRFLAYDLPNENDSGARSVHILRRGSSESSLLVKGPGSNKVLGWMPDGRELLLTSDRRGTVDAYRIRVVDGKAVGEPALVRANIGSARALGFRANGTFYFINEGLTRAVKTATFDAKTGRVTGSPQLVTQRLVDWLFVPRWSPDASMLVYASGANSVRREAPVLTFRTVATGEEKSVPLSPIVGGIAPGSAWSGDSQYLYVDAYMPNGEGGTIQVNPRSGEARRIAPGICHQPLPSERALLCFVRNEGGMTLGELQKYDLTTGSISPLKKGAGLFVPRPPSPDGRFLLYTPLPSRSIRLFPLADGEERELVRAGSDEGLIPIEWVGKEGLAYLRLRSGGPAVSIRNIDTGAETELRGVDMSRLAVHNSIVSLLSFHPNGREIVWVSNEGKNELWALGNIAPAVYSTTKK